MQVISEGQVLGAEHYQMDSGPVGFLYLLNEPAEPDHPNHIGQVPSKMSCTPQAVEQLKKMKLPGNFRLTMRSQKAAQGKTGFVVTGVEQVPSQSQRSSS